MADNTFQLLDETELASAKHKKDPKPEPTHLSSIVWFFTSSYIITGLLVFVPVGIAIGATEQNETAVFIINFLAIIPLAKLLGDATEELAEHTNQSIGGLLNATFGNAVEIIISIFALKRGLIRVVQSSLIGSILSNLLLVLGMCFLAGGYYHKTLNFNGTAAQTSTGLLFISVLGIMMPAALHAQIQEDKADYEDYELHLNRTLLGNGTDLVKEEWEKKLPVDTRLLILSRGTAIVMIIIYCLFLFFQLRTHKDFYENTEVEPEHHDDKKKEVHKEDSSEEEGPNMTWPMSLFFLAVITVIVAVCSDYLVDSIGGITEAWGISQTFAGMVLLPIVGNAAEHLTAVTVSIKNKMDLAIGVAVGSSQQIAMMVTPLMVILGWIMGQSMSLYFQVFETAVLFMTVILVFALLNDGSSNWLEGAMLIGVYVILGIAFYVA
jgi:Ca2+:H+ antiporter